MNAREPDLIAEAGRRWAQEAVPASRGLMVQPDIELYEDEEDTGSGQVRLMAAREPTLERRATGWLRATRRSKQPRTRFGAWVRSVRVFLFGEPLQTAQRSHETLTRTKALAVLSSDAISSVAYGPEQVLFVLVAAGVGATVYFLPIIGAILLVLAAVAISYRQTIRAYPGGGGSYIVAKDNLGVIPGLTAAASLMTDYVLTVAVSISAGVDAITSAFPQLSAVTVEMGVVAIALLVIGNLRGIRESGTIFMAPTYLFIASMALVIGVGLWDWSAHIHVSVSHRGAIAATEGLSLFLILRAFASGSSSLTGVEAISDGVIAFRHPQWRNARTTLTLMALILGGMLAGVALLARAFGILPSSDETVLSQLAHATLGDGIGYLYVQFATALILLLAANTAFSDFPRLFYFLARDSYAPRQFANLGERLAFSNGIVVLGALAATLYAVFEGNTNNLIPLYAIGVFASFTLSQTGMVMRWWRMKGEALTAGDADLPPGQRARRPDWRVGMFINAFGAVMTGLVLVITASTKFTEGAWLIVILIPSFVMLFLGVHRHYSRARQRLTPEIPLTPGRVKPVAVVPARDLDVITMETLALARRVTDNVIAIHISDDPAGIRLLQRRWEAWGNHVPLEIIESPYRSVVRPLLEFLDAVGRQDPGATVMVFLPELVYTRWWHQLLHNQTALRLKAALLFRPGTVVVSVPYHLREESHDRREGDRA